MRYKCTTGLSDEQFEELYERIRQVVVGRGSRGGRPAILGLWVQLEMLLVAVRQNLNQMAIGDLYGVSQPTVSRIYRSLMPVLDQVLCVNEPPIHAVFAHREVLVDGTDVPTRNRKGADHNYSGKRHRQGLNIQVAAAASGSLLAVSAPMPGCRHDRRAITECGWETILNQHTWLADPAYQGTSAITPKKRTQNRDLTHHERVTNKTISSRRSAVERCIGHLKNWKILATGYRGILAELPNVIRIITRLEFYRLGW